VPVRGEQEEPRQQVERGRQAVDAGAGVAPGVRWRCPVTAVARCGALFPTSTPAMNERVRDDSMAES
jgi:hypothetical protein